MVAGMVVMVTGGARGIGLAIGAAMARTGAQVILGDIDGSLAAQAAAQLPGGQVGMRLDVRDEASCRAFVDAATHRWGRVDVLVNCAGVAVLGEFVDVSAAEQELQIDVNLLGVVRMIRLVLPGMLERRQGHVVNIASAVGRIPAPRAAIYGATKHAVVGLTESLRWETRARGVSCSSVLPTVVATEMAAGLRTPGLPVVSPDAVAATVVRLVRRKRPPASVFVPRWFSVAAWLDMNSPAWIRERARTFVRLGGIHNEGQVAYQDRVSRQMDGDQVTD